MSTIFLHGQEGNTLPELDNPAAPLDVRIGKQFVTADGKRQTGSAKVIDSNDIVVVANLFDFTNIVALDNVSCESSVTIEAKEGQGVYDKESTFQYKRYVAERDGEYRVIMKITPYRKESGWYASAIGKVRVNDKFIVKNDNYSSSTTQYTNTISLKKGDIIDFGVSAYIKRVSASESRAYTHTATAVYTIDYSAFANIGAVSNLFKIG